MAFKKPKTKGLAGAEAMTKELAFLTSANIEALFLAEDDRKRTIQSREKGTLKKGKVPTHSEVLKHLADGGRSLYPNEKESIKAGKIIRDRIAKHLKKTGKVVTNKQGVTRVLTKDKQAMAGASSGLRSATKYIAKMMSQRMERQGTTSGGSADEVSIPYAIWREDNYNVNESVVYVASGQLANALASGKVKVKLINANIGKLIKSASK